MASQILLGVVLGVRSRQSLSIPPNSMPLTDTEVRTAKILDKPYKLADERGLYLLVNPSGSRLWRFKYRVAGVEKLLALGSYPDTSLQKARAKRDAARMMLADGGDPGAKRKAEKHAQIDTFAAVAEEWLETKRATLTASTWQRDRDQLVKIVGPQLGKKPVAAIEAPDLLAILRKLEEGRQRHGSPSPSCLWSGVSICHCHGKGEARYQRRPEGCVGSERNCQLCGRYRSARGWRVAQGN